MRVAVIGAGSWGSTVACLLGGLGHAVCLWARDPAFAATLNATHYNPRYLPDIEIPTTVSATTSLVDALEQVEAIILATPSAALGEMAKQIGLLHLSPDVPVLLLSKGIERDGGRLLLEMLADVLGTPGRLAVLSGPNHAEEVARGIASATVIASRDAETAAFFQSLFATPAFRVYTSSDTIGVQLCGAAKNIIAIACGLAVGLGMGDNTLALLMTRGLAEISRLVACAGGEQMTCMGLAGMGDLVATCTSRHSRNRGFGLELATGGTLTAYEQRTHMVIEGALASLTVTDLARLHEVELPISETVRAIVWEGAAVENALAALLDRTPKPEFY